MSLESVGTKFKAPIIQTLEKFPILSVYAKTRGWYFVISWAHRITGILLVIFVWLHIYSLDPPHTPSPHDGELNVFQLFIFGFLKWLLAIPIIFHAFNGGRLILYESFGKRNDESLIRWMFGLSILYLAILGLFMLIGNQGVSEFFYWTTMLACALTLGFGVAVRIWNTGHSLFWKWQRISGGFLLVMVPAYLLFIHLDPSMAKETNVVIIWIEKILVKAAHLGLLVGALYHGGYGIWSVLSDYLSSKTLQRGLAVLVSLVTLIFAWLGIKVTLGI